MRKILALLLSLVLANPVAAQTIAQPPGTGGGGGGGTPGGSSGQVQYNNAGAFGGFTVGGDGTLNTSTGALSVTKTGGVSFGALATVAPGTGVATALGANVGAAGSFVVNGGALGTPSSGTLTNATGLPLATGISGFGTGIASALAINTGSAGAPVLLNGALGTPSSGTLTNATGLPVSTGISGLGTGVATALGNTAGAAGGFATFNQLGGLATITPGTGVATAAQVNIGSVGSFLVNGGALGTPSSGTLTNATGLPIGSGVSGLGLNVATALGNTAGAAGGFATFSQLGGLALITPGTGVATALGVNVGSAGSIVVNGGALGTPSSGTLTNATGLPVSTGISGLGTGVATALANTAGATNGFATFNQLGALATLAPGTGVATALGVNVGTAGAFVVNGGALGTPSSGTLTNATGLPISSGVSGLGTGVATALAVNTGSAGAFARNNAAENISGAYTFTSAAPQLTLGVNATTLGSIKLFGNTSGDLTLRPAAAAGTASTVTLPGRSGTVAYTSGTLTDGNCAKFDASGNIIDNGAACGGGGGTPGGSSGQVQYNNAGAFGGFTVGGDGTLDTSTGALSVTKTGGVSFSALATLTPAAGIATWLGTPSSANLASAVTDETGSGALVFGTSPSLTTPNIGAASGSSVTLTGTAPQVTLGLSASVLGSIKLFGSTSGDLTISPPAVAGTASAVTFPGRSGTVGYTSGTLTNNDCAKFDASGNLVAAGAPCGVTVTPGGTSGQVQYNNAGAFGGFTVSGDGTLNTGTGALSVTKTGGVNFSTLATLTPGTGVATALGVNVGTAGAFVVNGGALGTPSSGTLTNASGLPVGGITGFGTGVATALGVNVGSAGAVVVNGGALGTPSSGTLTNATGLPISTGVSGLGSGVATALGNTAGAAGGFATFNQLGALATITPGTGVATALGVNIGTAGSVVTNGGALGTPSSGTLTNATGLPISTGVSGLGTGVATALGVNVGSAGAFARNNAAETISGAYTFTSAAPQLTLGANATTLGSIKLFGNTSGDVTVKAQAAAGTATNFALPSSNGTAGYHLRTDGSGNTSWVAAREVLTADRTYYVRTNGSDSNTGLANTAGGAFLTLQHAFDVAASIDSAGWTVTIKVADGTYTGGVDVWGLWLSGPLVFEGNTTTPANCVISTTSASAFDINSNFSAPLTIKGFKVQTTTAGHGIYHKGFGEVRVLSMDFGAVATNYSHMVAEGNGAKIAIYGNYSITGSALRHVAGEANAYFINYGSTVTLTGSPAFTQFAFATRGAVLYFAANTFTGSATGQRCYANLNGVADTSGQTLPGSTAGSTATGGQGC